MSLMNRADCSMWQQHVQTNKRRLSVKTKVHLAEVRPSCVYGWQQQDIQRGRPFVTCQCHGNMCCVCQSVRRYRRRGLRGNTCCVSLCVRVSVGTVIVVYVVTHAVCRCVSECPSVPSSTDTATQSTATDRRQLRPAAS